MNSYTYRDLRRQRLTEALDALAALPELSEAQQALVVALQAEQAALQTDDWTVTDQTYLAAAVDMLWPIRLTLLMQVEGDPALAALGLAPRLTAVQAAAVEDLPHGPGGPPPDYLDQVRAAVDGDATVFTELVHTGHRLWLGQPAETRYPFDDVGVLLPLRLETLFDAPGSRFDASPTQWQLLLRVTPDEASICRDDPHVSDGEVKALTAFWQAIKQPGDLHESWLEGDVAGIAWQQLADRVTPARAAWLVPTLVPQFDGEGVSVTLPVDMPATAQPNRVGGLPPELRVFAVTAAPIEGRVVHPIGRLPMAEDQQIDQAALTLPLPGQAPVNPDEPGDRERWWASWDTAKAVGLGGEWLLPAGMTPENITALYVVGIGDEAPDAHFKAQVDAGELSVLRLGAPTNTVRGAAAASMGADWRAVAQARLRQRLDPQQPVALGAGRGVQQHLSAATLPFFPGADWADETGESQRLVQALWPALWGHWLRDLWQVGDRAHRVGFWAMANLYPEGPLAPLRIGDQPYGLLPVTALAQWEPAAALDAEGMAQRQVEAAMARALAELRGQWANAAYPKRTVVDKSTAQFVELLGQDAVSQRYLTRQFTPARSQTVPYQLGAGQQQQFDDLVLQAYRAASDRMGNGPVTSYLANGYWRRSILPLVQPSRMIYRHRHGEMRERLPLAQFISLLFEFFPAANPDDDDLERIFRRFWVLDEQGEYQLGALPNSLLIRLLIYACQITFAWRRSPSGSLAERRVLRLQQKMALELADMLDNPAWHDLAKNEQTGEPVAFLLRMPADRRSQLERALRATLDSAAHRIDPWITGFAWQRLKQHSASPRRAQRLGAYGWVDGPFRGQPGPTDAGRLHTPSYNQTLAALILRDKFLASTRAASINDGGRNPWEMNITASKARLAEEIADEVRMGFHIYEIVGRYVENIIGVHQTVKELRLSNRYAMRPERKDPHEVCNGIEALKGLLARDADGNHVGDADFPLNDAQLQELERLYAALDTYGDLLMADGVMQVINRQVDRAAETMDAAAGFSRPPAFEFTRTPPSGYQLESLVISALPFVAVDDLPADANPIRLADPSVAAFVDSRLAGGWIWRAVNDDDETVLGAVDLATLGLAPSDTLAFSDELLREWARRTLGLPLAFVAEERNRAWRVEDGQNNVLGEVTLVELNLLPATLATLDETTLHGRVRTTVGAADDARVEEIPPLDPRLWVVRDDAGDPLGLADPNRLGLTSAEVDALAPADLQRRVRQAVGVPQVRVDPPRQHQLAQQLTAALGNRPAAGRDIAGQALDEGIRAELNNRYQRLHAAGRQTVHDLVDAADDEQRAAAIRRACLWGVTPTSDARQRDAFYAILTGQPAPAAATLTELVMPMAETLASRLDRTAVQQAIDDLRNAIDDDQRRVAIRRALVWGVAPTDEEAPLTEVAEQLAVALEARLNRVRAAPDTVPGLTQALAALAAPQGKLAILARWSPAQLFEATQLAVPGPEPALDEAWLTVVAATRASLARLEALQLELDLPLEAWSNSPGDPWQRARIEANLVSRDTTSPLGLQMPRFVAAYGSADAWLGGDVAVGLIDAFSEAIPMPQRTTLTAFGFNAPAARAPQAILLAVPPRPRQRLDDELLWQIVAETRELAHARTARVEDLGELQALTPTMWLQSSGATRVRLEAWPLFD